MKIVLASMAPFMGGAEIALERLALGLQEKGHEVFVLLGNRKDVLERLSSAGLRCLYSPMYFTDPWHMWRYWRARRCLRRMISRERPDVVHSNDLQTHQIVSDAARGLGIPRICHHRFTFDGPCLDWLNKFGAEHHIFISYSLMEELIGRSEGLRESSRTVVYDGLPILEPPTPEARLAARKKLGLLADRRIVLFAGQIIEIKGVADLIRAWSLLLPRWRDRAELLILGEDFQQQGAYRRKMEELARTLECPVHFVGFQKDVREWQMAADVAVVPSHIEPLGLVALESMALGLPVVATAVGGICETVCHGLTGLLVPPRSPEKLAEALDRMLGDEMLCATFGARGRERCEEIFDLRAHVDNVVEQYSSVTQRLHCGETTEKVLL